MVLLRGDRILLALARNLAHRLKIARAVRLLTGSRERGGDAWSARSIEARVAHVLDVFSLLAEHVGDVSGKVGLEIGPGDDVGVAHCFLKAGCAKMFVVERCGSVIPDAGLAELLREIDRRMEARGGLVDAGDVMRSDRGRWALDPERLDFRQARFEDVELDQEVDFIYSNDVLEHVASPRSIFDAARRLLKPGGVFVSNIDLAGHNVFSRRERPLDFLSCPDTLWRLMFSHVVTTNRVRLSELVAAAKDAGLVLRQVSPLARADRSYLESVRPHLLPRYQALSDDDLGVVQCILVAERPGARSATSPEAAWARDALAVHAPHGDEGATPPPAASPRTPAPPP